MDITANDYLNLPVYANLFSCSPGRLPMSEIVERMRDVDRKEDLFFVPTAIVKMPLCRLVGATPDLTRLTGLVVLVVQNVPGEYHLEELRERLKGIPYVLAAFLHWNYRDRLYVIVQTLAATLPEYVRCHVMLTKFIESYNPPKPHASEKKAKQWYRVFPHHVNVNDFVKVPFDPMVYYNPKAEVMEADAVHREFIIHNFG